jgi:UDP-2,3-diacylglucosamine pyrophosphatase LpxH
MKKSLPAILAIIVSLLVFSFLAWAFSLHGTAGLYHVNGFFRRLLLGFGLFGLAVLLLALLYLWLKSRAKPGIMAALSVVLIVMSVPAIAIPPLAFVYTNDALSAGIGDTPPQLIMADGTGAHGVPDMAVTFNSETASLNTLTWGRGDTSAMLAEDTASKSHVFMLRDLEPDTAYWYSINGGDAVSFTTPPADGALRFAVASDAHFGAGDARNDLTALMLADIADPANDFDAFFYIGDLVEYGFSNNQWREAFKAFSAATSVIPVRFAAGNHDTLFSGFGKYKSYCYPEGMELETGSRIWYRIDIGSIHFLILDLEWSAEAFTPEQEDWLEAQLAAIPDDDWKIVLSHCYYYGSGSHSNGWDWFDNPETIERLAPIFERYGVDIVFSGHNHQLELLQNAGVTYAVCGAFGGIPDEERTYTSPASLWYASGEYAFIDVMLDGDICTLTFPNPDFEALATFTIEKS